MAFPPAQHEPVPDPETWPLESLREDGFCESPDQTSPLPAPIERLHRPQHAPEVLSADEPLPAEVAERRSAAVGLRGQHRGQQLGQRARRGGPETAGQGRTSGQ